MTKTHLLALGLANALHGLGRVAKALPMPAAQVAGCEGKEAYATAAKAWDVIKKHRPGQRRPKGRHVYRCKFCHQWHTGTSFRMDL